MVLALTSNGGYDVLDAACPTRQIVNRIGDRWTLLVLCALESETLRFEQLRRTVDGISQKMLTQTVRALERDGLLTRTVHATVPPRVDYALTPLGQSLSHPIGQIRTWAYENIDQVQNARVTFDQRTCPRMSDR